APVRSLQHFPLETLDIDFEEIDRPPGVLLADLCQGHDGYRVFHELEAEPPQLLGPFFGEGRELHGRETLVQRGRPLAVRQSDAEIDVSLSVMAQQLR